MAVYEVALSFAGEQRDYVEQVALALQDRRIAVFYDRFEEVDLWGKDLAEEFNRIFELDSSKVVMFVSKDYVEKAWPRLERRSTISRYLRETESFVLPVRFDDTPVPGMPDTTAYLRADLLTPAELASMVAQKLGISPFQGNASDVPPPRATALEGEIVFDYSAYDGRYVIGRGQLEFESRWSKASNTSIHVYNHPKSINGVALYDRNIADIGQVSNAESLDFTSKVRTPRLGQIVVFRNTSGFYAAVQILGIKDDSRGDARDELRFRYIIQSDRSDDFTAIRTTA